METPQKTPGNLGAIVLCGGRSRRMGFPKWKLPVDHATMLEHIVQSISKHVSDIVIAAGDEEIQSQHDVIRDKNKNCGPLEGIRAGLNYLSGRCDFAYVTACDTPYFVVSVVDLLMKSIQKHEAAIPASPQHVYGMNGIYKTDCQQKISRLIDEQKLRVSSLATELDAVLLPVTEIRKVDPDLRSIHNLNRPKDYFEFLESNGHSCPREIRNQLRTK